ncbi:MAG: hypothetical protein F6K42_07320 [Leptolyngbya sp. SIO1D8]|nr:hypothetical protein [Leptolyngbya sp. SIO1D8]
MTSSLKDMVSAIAPTISSHLISAPSLAAIGSVAQHFPITLSTTIGFECPLSLPLSADDINTDFFFRVSGIWGQSLLAGQSQPRPILEQLESEPDICPPEFERLWQSPAWQRIRQFSRQWSAPNSLLQRAIDDLWLEFDVDSDTAQIPLPSSFFGIKSSELPSLDWIGNALPLLLGKSLASEVGGTLQQCLEAIPASARVFQIGALSGRAPVSGDAPALRLYVQNLQQTQLSSTLKRLAYPGDGDLLVQLLNRICPGQETYTLQLEIQDTLTPVIAIECYFSQRADWQKILNRLVMAGFCAPERAQALLNYPGYVRAQDTDGDFPPLLQRWSDQLTPYRECLLVKRLAYLKFTYQPGYPLWVKAYVGVSPTWVDSRYLDPSNAKMLSSSAQESAAIQLCKALIQQLDYGEVDVDELFVDQRSQKSRWLKKALETMCIGG